MRARGLTTLADSTSQKFLLLGQVARKDRTDKIGRIVLVQIDFTDVLSKKCSESDFEKWEARTVGAECLMGHKVHICSTGIYLVSMKTLMINLL